MDSCRESPDMKRKPHYRSSVCEWHIEYPCFLINQTPRRDEFYLVVCKLR